MEEGTAQIISDLLKEAPVADEMLIARGKSEDEVIELLVQGFREVLERGKGKVEPDFSASTMNAFSFYLPVIMLLDKPD